MLRPPLSVSLDDKYLLEEGRIFLSGIQALVRVPVDQHRADVRAGLRTGTFISGYQGSPLGVFDQELLRNPKLCAEHDIHLQPGVNEELGATAVWGSQLAPDLPGAARDGVVGLWYGKNPGLDRAADAIRHANFCGVPRHGGAVAIVGDDPSCKSSTLPSAAEPMLAALHVPVLWPGTVQEVLDLGRHAIALSRASGLWSALKIVTNVADAAGTAEVAPGRVVPVMPELLVAGKPYVHRPNPTMLAPDSLISERGLFDVRLPLARMYARENRLNRVTVDGGGAARIGLVAAGKTYRDLVQALQDLGLDLGRLRAAGVRVMQIQMPWPLDRDDVRDFAEGLEEILVIEDKLPFLESQFRDLLYGVTDAPRILGKRDESGRQLLPAEGELDADLVARAVARRLRAADIAIESVTARIRELEEVQRAKLVPLPVVRTPFFCSGCPHNSSTPAADDALVGAGIGCHTMILLNREGRGHITGITQMGGEGAQWIGMSPFVEGEHFVQNLGDGTFHHSGSLAVRAACAAGVNVTYKLFANGSVAMTGSQAIVGGMTVPELTRWLALEGVKQVVVTAEDTSRYDGVTLDPIARVRPREDMLAVQEELSHVKGVTVLIHDQMCAAERRRLRKRGKLPEAAEKVVINERVCEGCGDCGKKSSCLSVQPVDTEFGRKTRIHQASCNADYSCLEGDCPSFLTVVRATGPDGTAPARAAFPPPPPLPAPPEGAAATAADTTVRMIGIGGTGVVTVSQILAMAMHLEDGYSWALDQTGLSQKGGPVISDVRLSRTPVTGSNKASAGRVDVYLGFDLLGAANPKNLQTADPRRTVAVVSTSEVATGRMVVDPEVEFPDLEQPLGAIGGQMREAIFLDAQALSQRLFGDHLPANLIVVGAALQRGLLPVSPEALEAAIRLNRAGVEKNLAALAWGRACVAAPDAVAALDAQAAVAGPPAPALGAAARAIAATVGAEPGSELERLLVRRADELIAYQSAAYARRYARFVAEVAGAERAACGDAGPVSEAAARGLHKLMAYKDEYEVARLHLDPVERAKITAEFGPGAKVEYHLHPPMLRAMGMDRKLRLGRWFDGGFRTLRAMKHLRGTAADPFGHAEVRKVERALVGEYETAVRTALPLLTPETRDVMAELCDSPDLVRGYEDIKLASVVRWRDAVARLQTRLAAGDEAAPVLPVITPAPFTPMR
ncbi:indolepyruvate ferredoxin oxidoreductase family protein [Paraconexibacter antarcticus]|uniref:Indolepyruvate ferredoxin oxidoreductase family protein n=1 Tax=Paraconexibacter antarcticus TaxID=2949664 RepID=A0ABY5DYM0_9ACTN|nr:indolepyruvate ferredoxin oxidoreductase family protein [Paraconexibacter antarcticus]UTI65649.1 indolepyruvate ferredoxin oxidoreductase family protein [Paraconexibacter antarcticus]